MIRCFFAIACFVLVSCQNADKEERSTLSSVDSNSAQVASVNETEGIEIQTFSELPSVVDGCSGLFSADTTLTSNNYVFVTNLKGIAFIKINNRLMELKLIRQTNIDEENVNELYANEEVEIDLKIKQIKKSGDELTDYQGVLIIRKGSQRKVVDIAGQIGC
jgi:hypothetical protein